MITDMESSLRNTYEAKDTDELILLRSKSTLTETAYKVLDEILDARGVNKETASERALQINKEYNEEIFDPRASIWSRWLAKLIDSALLLIISIGFASIISTLFSLTTEIVMTASLIIWSLYFIFKDSINGQSIGKRIMRIKVIGINTNKSCTLTQSAARNIPCLLGIFDAAFALGRKRMRLGDMIAGTQVITVKK